MYLRYNYIPTPFTIYKNIKKLLPGTFLKIDNINNIYSSDDLPNPESYWSLQEVIMKSETHPFEGSDEQAIEELDLL